MPTLDPAACATAERAWDVIDEAIDAAVAGRGLRHPSGTVFVPEDVPDRDIDVIREADRSRGTAR